MFRSVILLALFAVDGYFCINLSFKDCGSHGAVVHTVSTSQCSHEPCTVKKGTDYHGLVTFTATKDSYQAHAAIHGGVGLFSIPWFVPNENACNGDLPCPLRAGQTYTYNLDIYCPPFAPSMPIVGQWQLKDETGRDILCVNLDLLISD